MGAHTTGPWEAMGPDGLWIMADPDSSKPDTLLGVAIVQDHDGERRPATSKANARLIAAAPELLAALRGLANEVDAIGAFEHEVRDAVGHTNWHCLREKVSEARTTISKATREAS